jgi:protein ImuB
VGRLVVQLVANLQKKGLGVRRTDLIVEKVDGTRQAIRAGTAKPARDVAWLTKLFKDRTEKIEPGFGIEKLSLVAVMSEPLDEEQRSSSLVDEEVIDITPLIDIYGNRGQRVYRVAPVASDVPERSVQRIGAGMPRSGGPGSITGATRPASGATGAGRSDCADARPSSRIDHLAWQAPQGEAPDGPERDLR